MSGAALREEPLSETPKNLPLSWEIVVPPPLTFVIGIKAPIKLMRGSRSGFSPFMLR